MISVSWVNKIDWMTNNFQVNQICKKNSAKEIKSSFIW